MRFFEILERLGIKYVPYTPGPGQPQNVLEAAKLFVTDFLPHLYQNGNLTFWTLLFLAFFPECGYAHLLNVSRPDENEVPYDDSAHLINPNFYFKSQITTGFSEQNANKELSKPIVKLSNSFNNVSQKVINKLNQEEEIVELEAVTIAIQNSLKKIQDHLENTSLNTNQEQALIELIEISIKRNAKRSNALTATKVIQAFHHIEQKFLKTTVAIDKFYFPGDFAITADAQIFELPDPRISFYIDKAYNVNGKDLDIKPLFLHRKELLDKRVIQKIKKYLKFQQQNLNGLVYVELEAVFSSSKGSISYAEVVKNLLSALVGDAQVNSDTDIQIKKINSFSDNVGGNTDQHTQKIKMDTFNLVQERVDKAIRDPESFIKKARKKIEGHNVDTSLQQQIIATFNQHTESYFLNKYLTYISNMPDMTILTLPKEVNLKRYGSNFNPGLALHNTNIIFLTSFKNIKLPNVDIFMNLSMQPKPSVYGGVTYDDGIFNSAMKDASFQAHNLHCGFEQIAIQETRDMVHYKIGKHDLTQLMGNINNVQDLREAIIKSQIVLLRLKIMVDKILKGHPLKEKLSKPLPDKLVQSYKLKSSELNKYVDQVDFNETKTWSDIKACFEEDFSNIEHEQRYIYVSVAPDKNIRVGNSVPIQDPLQKIEVSAVIEEIKMSGNKAYVKLKLPDITEPQKIYAYALQELVNNVLISALDTDGMEYSYDKAFEALGRIGEVYNKFKSSADLVLSYLQPSLNLLNAVVNKALVKQFFENVKTYLQDMPSPENSSENSPTFR